MIKTMLFELIDFVKSQCQNDVFAKITITYSDEKYFMIKN